MVITSTYLNKKMCGRTKFLNLLFKNFNLFSYFMLSGAKPMIFYFNFLCLLTFPP